MYSEKFGHPTSGWPFYYADRDLLLALVREYKMGSAKQKIRKTYQSERPLLVFVSSVMNRKLENLDAERQMARIAIEDVGFARPWLFEDTPASSESLPEQFLSKVRKSDFFILILGEHVTDNVVKEYKSAARSQIKRLIFLKGGVGRSQNVELFVKKIGVKYKEFWSLNDLRAQISSSLMDEILRLARRRVKS